MRARDNPFRSDRIEQLAFRFSGDTWETLLERFLRLGRRGAIVGPEGTGKTTLLEQTAARLTDLGYRTALLRLTADDARQSAARVRKHAARLGRSDVLLLDGADHMPRLSWLRLRQAASRIGGLLITSHRPGLLPTIIETAASLSVVRDIVAELLGGSCAAVESVLPELLARRGGNVRLVLRDLYDIYARL